MANPFLMDDEPIQSNDSYINPFLIEDLGDGNDDYAADNPFAGQGTNPFAAFGDAGDDNVPTTTTVDFFGTDTVTTSADMFLSNTVNEIITTSANTTNFDPVSQSTHFFDTTINEDEPLQKPIDLNIKNPHTVTPYDDSLAYSSEDELKMKRKPPRPPPSKATQDLIMSVANELDQASSHLLDRLPKTRTPSPVSMRDLHSPSPTPDIGFGDLLDGLDDHGLPMDVHGLPMDTHTNFFDDDLMGSSSQPVMDNPFADPIEDVMKDDINKNQPPRPPPPRPTPPAIPQRPSPITHHPPPLPPQPHHNPVPQQEQDFIDIFGTNNAPARPPKPPPPKTTQDILSLYSAPAPTQSNNNNEVNKIPDLMSDDLLDESIPIPIEEKTSSDLLPDFSNDILSQQPPIDMPDNVVNIADQDLEMPPPPPPIEQQITPPEELIIHPNINDPLETSDLFFEQNTLDIEQSNSNRASVFNMTVTCEPDNPPSSDEEMNEEPEPEAKTDENTEPLPEITDPIQEQMQDPIPEPMPEAIPEPISEPLPQAEVDINPFGSPPKESPFEPIQAEIFAAPDYDAFSDIQQQPAVQKPAPNSIADIFGIHEEIEPKVDDSFDAFAAKFESADNRAKSPNVFMDEISTVSNGFSSTGGDAWGDSSSGFNEGAGDGFGADEGFDTFVAMPPVPKSTPFDRNDSHDSDEAKEEFNVFIRPKEDVIPGSITPILAPPPKSSQNNSMYSGDSSPRFNPFDKGFEDVSSAEGGSVTAEKTVPLERTDSQESPATPLFDDDVSQPLEDFPRLNYAGDGWEMQLRQPNKKRITAQRFWKKIIMKLTLQGDNPVLQLYNSQTDKEPFQELPLQACYSVSDISAQQYDQYGKIFTAKLQYIFYKERPGVRPGQVTKAERITNKLSQFAAYAIQGDYQGVKEFGSDLKKLGLPVEHAPQLSELFKLGSLSFEDMKQFSFCIDEALFKLDVHRDRALNYKTEEVQITAVDELYVDQDAEGHVLKQIARVRLYFLGFLSGMPYVELGVNDLWRQGKEVVGRHDIIPVVTEEWIRLEGVEFHTCVHQEEYERSRTIKFQPPDACYIELMRFRIRPPKNRELPLQLKATWCVTGNKVDLRADILVPGFASRKLGQIPCEDVMIRFPIPECWIYLFRVEKHFRYGSVKSAHRRTGKVKGIERILGAVDQLQESLIEVTSGSAKYEHQHRALVWRCPRLPKEGQGAYTTHQLVCRLALTSYDQIPEMLAPFCYVEFTMPATQVSHTTVRSVSIQESESDDPPEKYVRYLARHEYKVGIEHTTNETSNAYTAATMIKTTIREEPPPPSKPLSPVAAVAPSDSDSDSN